MKRRGRKGFDGYTGRGSSRGVKPPTGSGVKPPQDPHVKPEGVSITPASTITPQYMRELRELWERAGNYHAREQQKRDLQIWEERDT